MDLQNKTKRILKLRGLKKGFVAEQIKVSPTFFSYWLNGHRGMKIETEIRLRQYLDL